MMGVGSGRVHGEGKEAVRLGEAQSRTRTRNRHDGVKRGNAAEPERQTDRQRATCPSAEGSDTSAFIRSRPLRFPPRRSVTYQPRRLSAKLVGIYFSGRKTGQAAEWEEGNPWSEWAGGGVRKTKGTRASREKRICVKGEGV